MLKEIKVSQSFEAGTVASSGREQCPALCGRDLNTKCESVEGNPPLKSTTFWAKSSQILQQGPSVCPVCDGGPALSRKQQINKSCNWGGATHFSAAAN